MGEYENKLKNLDEINLERACYLLCADEMLEEELGEKRVTISSGTVPEQASEAAEQ